MTTPGLFRAPYSLAKAALALIGAIVFAHVPLAASSAGGVSEARTLDDSAPALPISVSFHKGTDPDAGPYILGLKNTSKDAIKVTVKIHLGVTFHAIKKDRTLSDHTIDAGDVWSINDLAAEDKVTVTADGFAPLVLTVP